MSGQLRNSNLAFASVAQKQYLRISSILDSQIWKRTKAVPCGALTEHSLIGECEPLSQHKMSCLPHQETKFCFKKNLTKTNTMPSPKHLSFQKFKNISPALKFQSTFDTQLGMLSYIGIMWMKHFGLALIQGLNVLYFCSVMHLISTTLPLLTIWKSKDSLDNRKFQNLMGCLRFYIQYTLSVAHILLTVLWKGKCFVVQPMFSVDH